MDKWVLYTQPNYTYPKPTHLTPLMPRRHEGEKLKEERHYTQTPFRKRPPSKLENHAYQRFKGVGKIEQSES